MRKFNEKEKEYYSNPKNSGESLNYMVEKTHDVMHDLWRDTVKPTGNVYIIMDDGGVRLVHGGPLKTPQFKHSAEPECNIPCIKVVQGAFFIGLVTHERCISSRWKTYRDFGFVDMSGENDVRKLKIIEQNKKIYVEQLKPYFL